MANKVKFYKTNFLPGKSFFRFTVFMETGDVTDVKF